MQLGERGCSSVTPRLLLVIKCLIETSNFRLLFIARKRIWGTVMSFTRVSFCSDEAGSLSQDASQVT